MQYMHSYFQILKFPLIVIAFACFLCGVSNIILHPSYGLVTIIANDGVFMLGESLGIIARTILMYAPVLILLRLLTQKKNSSVTVAAGLVGYFAFHIATMFVPAPVLPSYAYNAVFNIGTATSSVSYLSGSAHYPILSGMIGTIIVTMVTYIACRANHHLEIWSIIPNQTTICDSKDCCVLFIGGCSIWCDMAILRLIYCALGKLYLF